MIEHVRISKEEAGKWELWFVNRRGNQTRLAEFSDNSLSRRLLVQAAKDTMRYRMVEDLEVDAGIEDIQKIEKIDPELFSWVFTAIIP